MTYCCCTPQIHCRYCQKAGKPPSITKPFFNISDEDFEKFRQKTHGRNKVKPAAIVVARQYEDGSLAGHVLEWAGRNEANDFPEGTKLYTSPPQRQPLTYVDLRRVANQCGLGANEVSAQAQAKVDNFARAIEAAHGIKGEA